ncbi:MAG: phosphate signaling complex protein PhoU [Deltaproteobacteria bacterium]|nr:phosphate signaling complex protein PhoU [Deltaproteobacteria bacterium]
MSTLHTDRDYESDLRKLREQLLLMAGRVEEMIGESVRALVDRDAALARKTIDSDHKVNRAELAVDEQCLLILVKRHPMASDLRFVTRALKMVTDLERIGDLAVNICERAIDLAPLPLLKPYEDIPRMSDVVQSMVRDAIDAFVSSDSDKAEEIMQRDDEVDELYHQVFREILALMIQDPRVVECGVHLQSVAKYLERIGDHATNLAEQVIFMVRAKDVRHAGKLGG